MFSKAYKKLIVDLAWDAWQSSRQALEGEASNYRPTLGQRKAAQIGKTIGVLVQNQDSRVAAVTDLGRVTWLNQDVTGSGVPVITDNSKVNARLIAENERLQDRITGYRHTPEMDDYISVLQEAFDIIQSDANTEENYRSMCQIGSVLRKLKAKQEQGQ